MDGTEFTSILYRGDRPIPASPPPAPPAFAQDLNLDQVVAALAGDRQAFDLRPVFYTPLREPADIRFRQAVMQDLERPELFKGIKAFSAGMAAMREHLRQAEKLSYPRQQQRWRLEAAAIYCQAVQDLAGLLEHETPASAGLQGFRRYLAGYAAGPDFLRLRGEAQAILAGLGQVRFTLFIRDAMVRVQNFAQEADYSLEVAGLFEKFRQGEVKDYQAPVHELVHMNHVEAQILEFVAQLNPGAFEPLAAFQADHPDPVDPALEHFDREVQFYLAFMELIAPLQAAGLPFCYPQVDADGLELSWSGGFDLALALQRVPQGAGVVGNDLLLADRERILVITGPNQGGKTTFARAIGQAHLLAAIGCPVPGRSARLPLVDRILTHFEQLEDADGRHGKLQEELERMRAILGQASPRSLIVVNEIFSATAWRDATVMAKRVLERILALGARCVCVTFLDELAALGPETVSMVSTVDPRDQRARTFRIVRQPADGLAYALALAEKHRLTYGQLRERLP